MKMHKLSLIAALALGSLLACTTLASAQESNAPKKGGKGMYSPEQRLERLSTELKLTDEQKPKVKAVLEDSNKKMQDLRNDTSLTSEQRREKFPAIREEETKKMKAILTPEQFEKYQTMRPGRSGGPGASGGEKKKAE